MKRRIFRLDEGDSKRIRMLADRVRLATGQSRAVVQIARTGDFSDPRYGNFSITRPMLESMVRNFDRNVYGQRIVLDVSHRPSDGAAGFFTRLFLDGNKLRGEVEFTPFGLDALAKRGMIYLSAEYDEDFVSNEAPHPRHGATLLGAALTPRPVIKGQPPVDVSSIELSELGAGRTPVLVSERVIRHLSEEIATMKKFLDELRKFLAETLKLGEDVVNQICKVYEDTAKGLADEGAQKALMEAIKAQGKSLSEQIEAAKKAGTGGEVTIKLDATALETALQGKAGLTVDQVKKLLADHDADRVRTAGELEARLKANQGRFTAKLAAAAGLSEATRKRLSDVSVPLITAQMTDAQVDALADGQIVLGNQMETDAKKLAVGLSGPSGSVQLSVAEGNEIKSLQELINKHLRGTAAAANNKLKLAEKVAPFVDQVLACFDAIHARRLSEEAKYLAGGEVVIGDTNLPASFTRTVIREALSDLNVLQLVQAIVDTTSSSVIQVPYETRDASGVYNDGVVYEGQAIHRAGISQALDPSYVVPMKVAILVSNEVMHFTRNNAHIQWDAWARSIESAARVLRELVVRRICNHMQREADAHLAANIANENLDAQLTGAKSTVKTAQFPIIRPFQRRDLAGTAIGAAEHPITVRLNGVAIGQYDGTGDQAAGTYYRVTSYNLGYIQFVNEAGVPQTPAATGNPDDISYSYATNLVKFDIDVPGGSTLEKHLNGLLRAVGARKAVMKDDRFVAPDFLLMSNTLNDQCTNAEQFVVSLKRDGTDTNAQGDLEAVKGIPAFGTNAPGVDLGDDRILMGQRGTLTYGVAKPFVFGEPFEAVNSQGKPIGKKQAYGEEYNAIHVPAPIRNRFTSVIVYSATARAAV